MEEIRTRAANKAVRAVNSGGRHAEKINLISGERQRRQLLRQHSMLEAAINKEVYRLYRLEDDDIKIIEQAIASRIAET